MLHLTHMDTIGLRELQQHASDAVRRVQHGETLGVTVRGKLVAVLSPPAPATGLAALMAAGRVTPAGRSLADLKAPTRRARRSSAEMLDELRADTR